MRRLWWPESLYELRPYGALAIGALAGTLAALRSWAVGDWGVAFAVSLLLGSAVIVYGGAVLQMRFEYRRRSRWNRERRY